MTEPVSPSVGWGVVHLFCQPGPLLDGEAVRAAVKQTVETGHQVVPVAILGHKADLAFMALGPDLRQLRRGRNIDLEGASGDLDLQDDGDVETAWYDLFTFDADGHDVTQRALLAQADAAAS